MYTGGCFNSGNQHIELTNGAVLDAPELRMYPNPNNGHQLFISIDLKDDVAVSLSNRTVSVDIYDAFGKRVRARTIAVQDGFINTVLELNGDLAAGMYLVHVIAADPTGQAGDAAHARRLVIQP